MPQVIEVLHPLAQHHLTQLREKSTSPKAFRDSLKSLSMLLACEATRDLDLCEVVIQTPLTEMIGRKLKPRVGLLPILRAGLGMIDPFLDLIPTAEVWHLGLYRDEATSLPVKYYNKLPSSNPVDIAFVLDPMLATGGSATVAIDALHQWGVPRIKLLSIIAAREGINRVSSQFQEVEIFTCAIDADLNSHNFIVPGLGDAGDRTFNTFR